MHNRNTWRSFQGCVIAAMPFMVAILTGIAAHRFLQQTGLPAFVTTWSALIIAACVFLLAVILKNKIGE